MEQHRGAPRLDQPAHSQNNRAQRVTANSSTASEINDNGSPANAVTSIGPRASAVLRQPTAAMPSCIAIASVLRASGYNLRSATATHRDQQWHAWRAQHPRAAPHTRLPITQFFRQQKPWALEHRVQITNARSCIIALPVLARAIPTEFEVFVPPKACKVEARRHSGAGRLTARSRWARPSAGRAAPAGWGHGRARAQRPRQGSRAWPAPRNPKNPRLH